MSDDIACILPTVVLGNLPNHDCEGPTKTASTKSFAAVPPSKQIYILSVVLAVVPFGNSSAREKALFGLALTEFRTSITYSQDDTDNRLGVHPTSWNASWVSELILGKQPLGRLSSKILIFPKRPMIELA